MPCFSKSSLVYGAWALLGLALPVAAAPLPGGASSLVETYQDWVLACQSNQAATSCVMRQVQSNNKTGQHVLTLELAPGQDGKLQGVLLMPFGLALAQGVMLKADDAVPGPAQPFSTCVPQGCLVPLAFNAAQLDKLKTGTQLQVAALALAPAQPVVIAVSLKGLGGGLKRMAELTK